MTVIGQATVLINLDETGMSAQLAGVQQQVNASGQQMTASAQKAGELTRAEMFFSGMALVGFGAAGASAFANIVTQATNYQTTLAQIAALTDIPKNQIAGMHDAILNLSKDIPVSPDELGAGAYFILSSGIKDSSAAMTVLKQAAEGTFIGLGETKVLADTLTSAMNAYRDSNLTAAQAQDELTAAVREGKGEPADFASGLSRVIPIASQLHVSLAEVLASVSQFTLLGAPVDTAVTGLRAVLQDLLVGGTTKAAKTKFAELGFDPAQLRNEIAESGLAATLQDIMAKAHGNIEVLNTLFPNIRALTDVLATASPAQAKSYTDILDAITHSAGTTDNAVAIMKDTTAGRLAEVSAAWDRFRITLGEAVLPALNAVLPPISHFTDKMAKFAENHPLITQVALALGAVATALMLIVGSSLLAAAAIATIATVFGILGISIAPIILIPLAIAAVVAAIILLAIYWDDIWPRLKEAPQAILDWFKGGGWVDLNLLILAPPLEAIKLIHDHWGMLFDLLPEPVQNFAIKVAGIFDTVANGIIAAFNFVLEKINGVLGSSAFGVMNDVIGFLTGGSASLPSSIPLIGGRSHVAGTLELHQQEVAVADAKAALLDQIQSDEDKIRAIRGANLPGKPSPWQPETDGGGGGSGGGGGGLSEKEKQAQQDLRDLMATFEAFHAATGGTVVDFQGLLKVAQDKMDLDKQSHDIAVGLAAAQIEANDAGFQLQKGIVAIAQDMLTSGRTMVEEAAHIATGVADAFRGAFSNLFSRPTKEGAALQLQIDELTKQRDELIAAGAKPGKALDAIDAEIKSLTDQKRVRDDNINLMKDLNVLADKTLITDQQQRDAAGLYTIALGSASAEQERTTALAILEGIAHANYIAALEHASTAIGGASTWTDAMKHWVNGIAASKGEDPPFLRSDGTPFAQGGLVVGSQPLRAILHPPEMVIPLDKLGSTLGSVLPVPASESGTKRSTQYFIEHLIVQETSVDAVLTSMGLS